MGSYHVAVVTFAGEVYTWGVGSAGQLGHGVREDCVVPTRVSTPQKHRFFLLLLLFSAEDRFET